MQDLNNCKELQRLSNVSLCLLCHVPNSLFEFHNAGLLISPSLNKSFFYNLMQMASLVGLPRVSDNDWTGFRKRRVFRISGSNNSWIPCQQESLNCCWRFHLNNWRGHSVFNPWGIVVQIQVKALFRRQSPTSGALSQVPNCGIFPWRARPPPPPPVAPVFLPP